MGTDDLSETVGNEGEGLVPGGGAVAAVSLDQRGSQPVGILVKLFQGGALRTDEARRERIRHVAPYPANLLVDDLDLQPAGRFAEWTGAIDGPVHRRSVTIAPGRRSSARGRERGFPENAPHHRPQKIALGIVVG
jgi:hypothetical protein